MKVIFYLTILLVISCLVPSPISDKKTLDELIYEILNKPPMYNWSPQTNVAPDCSGMMYWIYKPPTTKELEDLIKYLDKKSTLSI